MTSAYSFLLNPTRPRFSLLHTYPNEICILLCFVAVSQSCSVLLCIYKFFSSALLNKVDYARRAPAIIDSASTNREYTNATGISPADIPPFFSIDHFFPSIGGGVPLFHHYQHLPHVFAAYFARTINFFLDWLAYTRKTHVFVAPSGSLRDHHDRSMCFVLFFCSFRVSLCLFTEVEFKVDTLPYAAETDGLALLFLSFMPLIIFLSLQKMKYSPAASAFASIL